MQVSNKKPRNRIADFWYYHKVKILAGLIAVTIVTILTANVLSRPYYDLQVLVWCHNGNDYLDANVLEHVLTEYYAFDRNSDGKVNVLVKDASSSGGGMTTMPETERTAALQDPEMFLFLVDKAMYDFIKEDVLSKDGKNSETEMQRVFTDLEERYPNDSRMEDVRFYLQGSVIQEKLSEGDRVSAAFLGGLLFMVQNPSGGANEKDEGAYEDAMAVLDKIITEQTN